MISCAGVNKIVISKYELSELESNKKHECTVIMNSNKKIAFQNFSVNGDTLIISDSGSLFYKPHDIKIPFDQIKKIYILEYPHKVRNFFIFIIPIITIWFLVMSLTYPGAISTSGT